MAQKDEGKALKHVERYRNIVTEHSEHNNGRIVNFFGDGSLSVHESIVDAVQAAIAMQNAFREEPAIPVRIGIHLGEVTVTEETIYGNSVNIASRLHNLGTANSILVSGTVAETLDNHSDVRTTFIGPEKVKNIDQPINVHGVNDHGLHVPSRKEVHDNNKAGKSSPLLIPLLIVGAVLLSLLYEFRDSLWPADNIIDQTILVLTFKKQYWRLNSE